MSVEKVKEYFDQFGLGDRVMVAEESSATVEAAAACLGCEPARIAKTLSFCAEGQTILVVTAGDCRVDNKKYRDTFGCKAKMLKREEVEPLIGHEVGGVCPFGINRGVDVYLDVSLKRFETVYPAAGSSNSMIELTLEELKRYSLSKGWVDVSRES